MREIVASLEEHVREQIKTFLLNYRNHLRYPVETSGSSAAMLTNLLGIVGQTPYKLYLLIVEYDNFVNEVMVEKKGHDLRTIDEATLRRLPAVSTAWAEARDQVRRYSAALVAQRGEAVRPRCYAIVAIGLDRILGERSGQPSGVA